MSLVDSSDNRIAQWLVTMTAKLKVAGSNSAKGKYLYDDDECLYSCYIYKTAYLRVVLKIEGIISLKVVIHLYTVII